MPLQKTPFWDRRLRVPVDMVVLCVAMQARSDAHRGGQNFWRQPGCRWIFSGGTPQTGSSEYCYGRGLSGRSLSGSQGYSGCGFPGIRSSCQSSGIGHSWERWKLLPSYRGSIRMCVPGARPASSSVRILP